MFYKTFITLFVICGLCSFCTANSLSTDQQECPQICPLNYAPVCAFNGKVYKEFANTCELKASNCRLERSALQKFETTAMDLCNTEIVYGLQQLLEKLGNLDLDTPGCSNACYLLYSPVCVSNGQYRALLSNECIMEAVNCALAKTSQKAFKVLKYVSC